MPTNRFDRTAYSDASEPDREDSGADSFGDDVDDHGPEALRRLRQQLAELGDYARLFVEAKKDAMLVTLRKLALWGVAGIVAVSVLCTMLITATVLGMIGLAQLIALALGDRLWAGNLIVGFGLILLVALGWFVTMGLVQRRFHKKTVKKYAKRHQAQRSQYGHDVESRSQAERN